MNAFQPEKNGLLLLDKEPPSSLVHNSNMCSNSTNSILEECFSKFSTSTKQFQRYIEAINNRRITVTKNVETTKEQINQAAREMSELVEEHRKKLLLETELYATSTHQELDRTTAELHGNVDAVQELARFVEGLRTHDESLHDQLSEVNKRQKELERARVDITVGSLKFKRASNFAGNLLGEVSIGDIDASDPYLGQPVEIGIIEGEQAVAGVAVLKEKIYILRESLPNLEVYTASDLSSYRMLKLEGLRKPSDIASDEESGFLYISDAIGSVYKYEPDESLLTNFSTNIAGQPQGLHVVPQGAKTAGNLLVACYDSRQMREYEPDGKLVRSVRFQQDVVSPWHTVPLLSSNWAGADKSDEVKKFAVCHGWDSSKLHRICWIDGNGKTLKTFGASNGSGSGRVDVPTQMAVDSFGYLLVADRNNNRVILLSPNLVYVRDLISRTSGLKQPRRIHLDVAASHLYVGLIDGSVHIFRLLD